MSDASQSPAGLTPGFFWSGSLEEYGVRGVYAALGALRFSGVLELVDRASRVAVQFLGGDPVEIAGGDTAAVSLWSRGTFLAKQCVPTFDGELTTGLVLTGSLERRRTSALWSFIGQHRLTCDVELEHGPDEHKKERAHFRFAKGRAEKAELGGLPEMAALASVSEWTTGRFRLALLPLFVDPVAKPEVAPTPEPSSFDLSAPVQLPPEPVGRAPLFSAPRQTVPPPSPDEPELLSDEDVELDGPRAYEAPSRSDDAPSTVIVGVRRRRRLYIVLGAAVVGSVAAIAVVQWTARDDDTPVAVHVTPASPVVAEKPTPPAAEKAPVEKAPVAEKPTPPVEHPLPPPAAAEDPLVAKARLLLINGHPHTAVEQLQRAQKTHPADARIALYIDQARGKLGNAELDFGGSGTVTIDGKTLPRPSKLKLPAGPHTIDGQEVQLARGERRTVGN